MAGSDPWRGRRSLRLAGHDYGSVGPYFVTLCLHHRAPIFGRIVDGAMCYSPGGQMIGNEWQAIPTRFPGVQIDAWVVMPDHMHMLLLLPEANAWSLGAVIGGFKSQTTNLYATGVTECGWPAFERRLWQRNYYERIVRDDDALARVRQYIEQNPARWQQRHESQ